MLLSLEVLINYKHEKPGNFYNIRPSIPEVQSSTLFGSVTLLIIVAQCAFLSVSVGVDQTKQKVGIAADNSQQIS